MATPKTVLEKDGISAAGMVGEILAYLEEEGIKQAEEEEEKRLREEAGEAPPAEEEEEEEKEKIVWTLAGILDHVSQLLLLSSFVLLWFLVGMVTRLLLSSSTCGQ